MIARILPMLIAASAMADGVRPGVIKKEDLKEYPTLTGQRKRIVDEALELAAQDTWLKYTFGSSDPADGGLDCSGAVYYIFQQAGLEPPRTSADQFDWVKDSGALTGVSTSVKEVGSKVFATLKPGDLLFWSGTYEAKDGRKLPVSHVQIFLGHEKSNGNPVMAGSSDGRTYRGTKRAGYGVFDFKLPRAESKGIFLGYGLPPGK